MDSGQGFPQVPIKDLEDVIGKTPQSFQEIILKSILEPTVAQEAGKAEKVEEAKARGRASVEKWVKDTEWQSYVKFALAKGIQQKGIGTKVNLDNLVKDPVALQKFIFLSKIPIMSPDELKEKQRNSFYNIPGTVPTSGGTATKQFTYNEKTGELD